MKHKIKPDVITDEIACKNCEWFYHHVGLDHDEEDYCTHSSCFNRRGDRKRKRGPKSWDGGQDYKCRDFKKGKHGGCPLSVTDVSQVLG